MTINTSKQAIAKALGQTTNVKGTCQMVTRLWFNAPSAGDQDKDGDADAIDGWLSEPISARRYDRTPPPGKPVAFKNADGSGFGHRAMSLANGKYRSTDFDTATQRYKAGITGTANSLTAIERSMGLVYLGWSLTIDGHPIPKDPEPAPKPKVVRRRFGHVSLQFSDTSRQHTADLEKLFALGLDVISGTEGGPGSGNNPEELARVAEKYGYRLAAYPGKYDTWVAVKKENVVRGSFEEHSTLVTKRASSFEPKPKGNWGDRGIVSAHYKDVEVGFTSIGAVHQLTLKNAGAEIKKASDAAHSKKMEAWRKTWGVDEKLAFMNGDFNESDRLKDVYGGAQFTSCWDELKVYPPTNVKGGNIDAIGSSDADGRVECVSARVRDDSNFFLNTDHFLVIANFDIRALTD